MNCIPKIKYTPKNQIRHSRNEISELNRELIGMVKKELGQLNETLAALERNNEDCEYEMPLGHLTPPSDIVDLVQGKVILMYFQKI